MKKIYYKKTIYDNKVINAVIKIIKDTNVDLI